MHEEYSLSYIDDRYSSDWVMERLEERLALAEMAGEGDLPPWAVF